MRVAIVDDMRVDSVALCSLLKARLPSSAFVDVYDSGERFLEAMAKYDLIFWTSS